MILLYILLLNNDTNHYNDDHFESILNHLITINTTIV